MKKITWEELNDACKTAGSFLEVSKYDGIYGVPRGGCVIAAILSKYINLPILETPTSKTLIVDDICDSGTTLLRWPENDKFTIFAKTIFDDGKHYWVNKIIHDEWLVFPYEFQEAPAEDGVIRILQAIGEDPQREGLRDTPKRVTKSWAEIYGGYKQDPKQILGVTFQDDMESYDQIVLCKDIELYSTCEHHMLPFFGKAHIGYIPNKKVVGLSKLARLVEIFSRRLQIQERLTTQIANALQEHLDPIGVGVVIQAKHFCMMCRGISKQNSEMITSCLLGEMRETAKDEFLKLCLK